MLYNINRIYATLRQILKTLEVLPITNRTQVEDSRVMEVVEKWSNEHPSITPPIATSTPSTPSTTPLSQDSKKRRYPPYLLCI